MDIIDVMKVIIAGSRGIKGKAGWDALRKAVSESGFEITEVVSGCATGVDTLGELWALRESIPIKKCPADWKQFGRCAGIIRNMQMANYADALIALWDGTSKGTEDMIQDARAKNLKLSVTIVLA